jgi:energy-coupling factor transporter ATP-binding protein EcfA2
MMDNIVDIHNLSFSYPNDTQVLKEIGFSVTRGEVLGIIGPNGAGKSTLLFHLNGLYKGTGRVTILGMESTKPNLRKIRAKVGLVFQDPNDQLFMPTVRDDIAFGPINMKMTREEIEKRITRVMRHMNLEGYEELSSSQLSAGEKKRVALATVLVMEPEILVLDEPSASLDPVQRRSLIRVLRDLDTTMIIATHDLELVLELCSRVLLLDHGTIRTDGPCRDILSDHRVLEKSSLEVPASLEARLTIK